MSYVYIVKVVCCRQCDFSVNLYSTEEKARAALAALAQEYDAEIDPANENLARIGEYDYIELDKAQVF